jgi:hypothetical protein
MAIPKPSETVGPLAGHVRKGRTYMSPLAASGVFELGDWVRDDLPDLIWPVLVFAEVGDSAAKHFARWQAAVQDDLADVAEAALIAEGLDGRLTSLDRLVDIAPGFEARIRERAVEFGILPSTVETCLAAYPERPAAWLSARENTPPGQGEIDLLARAIVGVIDGKGHREALIKCLPIWSSVQAGVFSSSKDTIDLLRDYPGNVSTRAKADSAIRAMWGASRAARLVKDPDYLNASLKWAKVFWVINSMTTRCIRERDGRSQGEVHMEKPLELAAPTAMPGNGAHLRALAMDLLSSFAEALDKSPADLHERERHEVNAGLVFRAGRDLIAVLGAPDLWCMEHGAHIARELIEVKIFIRWMAMQHRSIYRKFQDYGAGKAKLYSKIFEEIPAEWLRPDAQEGIEELGRLSHNDDILDHRVVDTRDSFAEGKSLRAMAQECGLLGLYRHAYAISSGVSHSEWWSVETHCMERCRNPLHGGHLISSLSLSDGANVELAQSWVDALYALMYDSMQVLRVSDEVVNEAFGWLENSGSETEDEESPQRASE